MDNSFITISRGALRGNILNIKTLLDPETKYFAVVKSNAYGHGLRQVHDAIYDIVDGYAVHSLEEAQQLKGFGASKPVLIMGYIPLDDIEKAIKNEFHFVVFNPETLVKIAEITKKTGIKSNHHIKVETGTGRQGVLEKDLDVIIKIINQYGLTPEGIYTHFANIEDTTRHSYAMQQLKKFNEIINRFASAGIEIPMKHTACSAAALLFPNSHFNMVRTGISTYGYWPSRETYLSFLQKYPQRLNGFLKPALSWYARISQIKDMPKGSYISYGLTYKTTFDSRIAVVPIGYSDGYDRGFSNNAYVLAGSDRAPVRGRVCMNITMIDVTHIPGIKVEDEIILIGRQNSEEITADDLGAQINTINYEILSRINPFIPRYLVD